MNINRDRDILTDTLRRFQNFTNRAITLHKLREKVRIVYLKKNFFSIIEIS